MFNTVGNSRSKHRKTLMKQIPCQFHTNNAFLQRKQHIESFDVFHPLLDRLLQVKMAKCFQHGQVRAYQPQLSGVQATKQQRIIEAPSIQGSMKIFSYRPKTSQVKINYKPHTSRPKTTNTIIRSRTSEPRIQRKLELISKQPTEGEDDQARPSILVSKMFRRSSANDLTHHESR